MQGHEQRSLSVLNNPISTISLELQMKRPAWLYPDTMRYICGASSVSHCGSMTRSSLISYLHKARNEKEPQRIVCHPILLNEFDMPATNQSRDPNKHGLTILCHSAQQKRTAPKMAGSETGRWNGEYVALQPLTLLPPIGQDGTPAHQHPKHPWA